MNSSVSTQAAHHAIRLWLGLEDVKDVMVWADGLIAASPAPSAEILDLASTFREPRREILSRLRKLTTESREAEALRLAVRDLASLVETGDWTVADATGCLRDVAWGLGEASRDIFLEMCLLQDYLEWATGHSLDEADVRRRFLEATERILTT